MLAFEAVLHHVVGIGCYRDTCRSFCRSLIFSIYFQNFVLEKLYLWIWTEVHSWSPKSVRNIPTASWQPSRWSHRQRYPIQWWNLTMQPSLQFRKFCRLCVRVEKLMVLKWDDQFQTGQGLAWFWMCGFIYIASSCFMGRSTPNVLHGWDMQTSQTCFWGSPKLSPTCGELGWILPLRQRSVIRHLLPNIEVDHANLWRLEPFGICSDEWHDLRLALSRTVKLWPAQDCSHLVLWIF